VTVIERALAESRCGKRLAREAPGNNVAIPTPNCISHVSIIGDVRPVLSEHGGSVGVDLAEPDCFKPFRFEGEAETADSAEQVEMSRFWFIHFSSIRVIHDFGEGLNINCTLRQSSPHARLGYFARRHAFNFKPLI